MINNENAQLLLVLTCPFFRPLSDLRIRGHDLIRQTGLSELAGRAVIKAAVWPFVVVFGPPRGDPAPCFPEIAEPAGIQTLVSQPSVETFNESVLDRLSWFDVIEFDPVIDSPREKSDGW